MALLCSTRGDQLWSLVIRGHISRDLVNMSVIWKSGMAVMRCSSTVMVGEAQGEADEGKVLEKDHGEGCCQSDCNGDVKLDGW